MERREFITVAGTSTVAAVGATACAPSLMQRTPGSAPAPAGSAPEVSAFTTKFDDGLARIKQWSLSSQYPAFSGDKTAMDSLARSSMQSLFVTGLFRDLSPGAQADAAVQERMRAATPSLDDAADQMTEFLTSRTEADLAHVHAAFRQSDAGARIATALDNEAAQCGLSESRRVHLRTMFTQIEWRLTYQSPSLLINEYIEKADRLTASDVDAEARSQWVAAQIGPRLLVPQEKPPKSLKSRRAHRGLIFMGIGGLVLGLGAASGDIGGAYVMTVGAVLMLIGLITLLVAAGTSPSR